VLPSWLISRKGHPEKEAARRQLRCKENEKKGGKGGRKGYHSARFSLKKESLNGKEKASKQGYPQVVKPSQAGKNRRSEEG